MCSEIQLKNKKVLIDSIPLTAVLLGSLLSISAASAATIVAGQVNFTGTVAVNTGGVFFANAVSTPHLIDPSNPNTGGYSGLTGGTIQDLTGPATTGAFSVSHFITFNLPGGPVFFDLQNIAAGLGTLAACGSNTIGNVCTPAGSPFTLIQVAANQVEIDLSVSGVAYLDVVTTGSDPTSGLLTTQNLLPGTITDILAAVSSPGGITNSYSATFSSLAPGTTLGTPEPGTLGMIFTGLGLLGIRLFRRNRRG
jgi:hypothetical protein